MTVDAVVVGSGPAGLSAAEVMSAAGCRVLVADAKPSFGRKFLMAGKSGLNLTKMEDGESFLSAYGASAEWLAPMIAGFGPRQIVNWAHDLGQDTFTGSTGRVFPIAKKASPLLRAWLERLSENGVEFRTGWRWTGWDGSQVVFDTSDGPVRIGANVTVLCLGGASWRRLGSDGKWADILRQHGVAIAEFKPSNIGLAVNWSGHMQDYFGTALKAVRWTAGNQVSRGEAMISARGLEGGGIYPLAPSLRAGKPLVVDLAPDLSPHDIANRMASKKAKVSLTRWLQNSLKLPPVKVALFHEMTKRAGCAGSDPVELVKKLPIVHDGLRPLDEAISTAGGVTRAALNDDLMLKALPGVFCAGEMLDWDAPTGGYLLTGCFATGRWAGRAAARYLGGCRS